MGNNERGGSSSSSSLSSRKGKKSNSEKPKQPQRGLGVAQLEKIRLHGHVPNPIVQPPPHRYPTFHQEDMRMQTAYNYSMIPSSSSSSSFAYPSPASSFGFYPNIMTDFAEHERTNIRYGDYYQPMTTTPSWNPRSGHGMIEAQHFPQTNYTRQLLNPHLEDSQPNSESSETQELDLELRL